MKKTQRHQLIYLDSQADLSIHSCHADKDKIHQQLVAWLEAGLPCIYARQLVESGSQINLGLPLLIENKKQAIGFAVSKTAVLKERPLPRLTEMRDFFTHFYQINEVLPFTDFNFISVYGSFLFHYLSGQPFVHANSDLDLLITYQDKSLAQLDTLRHYLQETFHRTIDGELRFKNIGDISLKELFDSATKMVLVKNRDRIELIERLRLYECYPTLCVN